MKKRNKIEIKVSGPYYGGRPTVCFAIAKFLADKGFDVDLKLDADQNYDVAWSLKNHEEMKSLRKNTCISVIESQSL